MEQYFACVLCRNYVNSMETVWRPPGKSDTFYCHFMMKLMWKLSDNLQFKDVRVHAPITGIKLEIPIYFTDHSELVTDQFRKILSKATKNEIKCFDFNSIKRKLRPHFTTIIARYVSIYRFASPYGKT